MKNEKRFRVVASCDPYHARMNHRGQEVLKWDMTTPIKWVMDDDLTEAEAHAILDDYSYDLKDAWFYDEQQIAELRQDLIEDGLMPLEAIDRNLSWFIGEGVYVDGVLVYHFGDDSLRDDVMLYCIEEYD